MIIGVCGFIGCGKDTVADYLVNFHEYRRESFADSLKDSVAAVFGWDRIMLEGRTKESREWREQVDKWCAERLDMPTLTPRWVLQYWGTEVCRKTFHDDIWIASIENKLRQSKDNIVISPKGKNILRGISRDYVMQTLCKQLKVKVVEKDIEPYDVYSADEAFMTGTPFCMLPVTSLNGIKIKDGKIGKIYSKLLKRWSTNVGVDIKQQIIKWNKKDKNKSINSPTPYQFK